MFPKQLLVPQELAGEGRPYAVFRPFGSIVGSALECQQVLLLPEIDSLCDEERHHAPKPVGQQEGDQRRFAIENRHEVFQTPKGVGARLAVACGKGQAGAENEDPRRTESLTGTGFTIGRELLGCHGKGGWPRKA